MKVGSEDVLDRGVGAVRRDRYPFGRLERLRQSVYRGNARSGGVVPELQNSVA